MSAWDAFWAGVVLVLFGLYLLYLETRRDRSIRTFEEWKRDRDAREHAEQVRDRGRPWKG